MRSVAWVTAALGVAACGRELPPPRILGVTPSEIVQGTVPELRIDLEAVFPFDVRYGLPDVSVRSGVEAEIGGVALRKIDDTGGGHLIAFAPFALPVGVHDVRVELADGRADTSPASFTVVPGPFPESFLVGGATPDAPIENQIHGQPFSIAIQAVGPLAAEFNGAVRISVSHGAIEPDLSGPFLAGRRDETVTVPAPGAGVTITVQDALGNSGTSNPFEVLN
jgi:hypothetical protein